VSEFGVPLFSLLLATTFSIFIFVRPEHTWLASVEYVGYNCALVPHMEARIPTLRQAVVGSQVIMTLSLLLQRGNRNLLRTHDRWRNVFLSLLV
jgi:hypothetical protein